MTYVKGNGMNLYDELPWQLDNERIDHLVEGDGVRIERIVSTGHASAEGFWYDSNQAEWVAVLKGEAKLGFADDGSTVHLRPGDQLLIPAHRKHRVEWTSSIEPTVWLAVYFD